MSKCLREIRAGRLGYAVLYTRSSIADAPRARAEKSRATSLARQKINLRRSWEQLELILFGNFGRNDLLLTLTYDDEHLPPDRAQAVRRVKKYLDTLRKTRKRRGQTLKYVYVTEDKHGDGRLHHHMVVNGTGHDIEDLRALWPDGYVKINNIRPRELGDLARYLTKEPREYGKAKNRRTWSASQNLKRPERPKPQIVSDLVTLSVPAGAETVESSGGDIRIGEFGTYAYIKYIYLDPSDLAAPREISNDPDEDWSLWPDDRRRS